MAALIAAELAQFVRNTFHMPSVESTFWTDSTIVVHWLRRDPTVWKPFVANRIIAIRDASENGIWRHVQGTNNPADLLTRGLSADQLSDSSLWWQGPSWLADDKNEWPISRLMTLIPELKVILDAEDKSDPSERSSEMYRSKSGRAVGVVVNKAILPLSIYDDHGDQIPITIRRSELSSLLRVTSYVFRFVHNALALARARKRKVSKELRHAPRPVEKCDRLTISTITNIERQESLRYWIADA